MTSKSFKEWATELSDFVRVYNYWNTYQPLTRQKFADEQAFIDFIGNLCKRAESLSVVTGEWASVTLPPADDMYLESIGELDDDDFDDSYSRKDFKDKWGYRAHLNYTTFSDDYKFYYNQISKPCDVRAFLEDSDIAEDMQLDIENDTYTPAYSLDIGRTAERYQMGIHLETIGYYEAKRNPATDDNWFRQTFKDEINWEIENGDFLLGETIGYPISIDFVRETPLSPNNVYQHYTYDDAKKTYRAVGCYFFDYFYDKDNIRKMGDLPLKARLDLAILLDIIVYLYPEYQTVDNLISSIGSKEEQIRQLLADDGLVVKHLNERGIELHPMLKAQILRGILPIDDHGDKWWIGKPPKKSGDSVFPSAIIAKNRAIKARPYPPVVGSLLKDDSLPDVLRQSCKDEDMYAQTILDYNKGAMRFYLAISDPRFSYEFVTKPIRLEKEQAQKLRDEIDEQVALLDDDVYKKRCIERLEEGVGLYDLFLHYDVSEHLDLAIQGGLGLGDEWYGKDMFNNFLINIRRQHYYEVYYHYYQKAKKTWQDHQNA